MGGHAFRCALAGAVALCGFAVPAHASDAGAGARAVITSGPAGEVPETTATFAFEATAFSPLSRFECRLDGPEWRTCYSPMTYENLVGGPHRFEVRLWGPFADPTPEVRGWTVKLQTTLEPKPPPPVVHGPPPPTRDPRRRDAVGCAYAKNRPGEVAARRLERAITCVVNYERTRRGLRRVSSHGDLRHAAAVHARDMVRRHYFAHTSGSGANVADRVRRTGYLSGSEWWTVGEVLAWSRPGATPVGTVRAWMKSGGHKHVLLTASFRDVGISVVRGTPRGDEIGATAVGVFGRRD